MNDPLGSIGKIRWMVTVVELALLLSLNEGFGCFPIPHFPWHAYNCLLTGFQKCKIKIVCLEKNYL
jgi:hypothetical protein